jgi:hypothetical protein
MTTLKEKLIKIGAKREGGESRALRRIPRNLFADILRMIAELRSPPVTSSA